LFDYPLVKVYIAMENSHCQEANHGTKRAVASIAMSHYQSNNGLSAGELLNKTCVVFGTKA
jgi:hypothetical protein